MFPRKKAIHAVYIEKYLTYNLTENNFFFTAVGKVVCGIFRYMAGKMSDAAPSSVELNKEKQKSSILETSCENYGVF